MNENRKPTKHRSMFQHRRDILALFFCSECRLTNQSVPVVKESVL